MANGLNKWLAEHLEFEIINGGGIENDYRQAVRHYF